MKTFDEWASSTRKQPYGAIEWFRGVSYALEALAAERAAAQSAPHDTAYTRAVSAPRMGGRHPHDGRHIMSIGHWGMH
jgi:hypothetical protein